MIEDEFRVGLNRPTVIATVSAAAVGLGIWYAIIAAGELPPLTLPPPHACLRQWIDRPGVFVTGAAITAAAAVAGLAWAIVLGLVVSIAMVASSWLRAALFPYALALQTMPVVAVAPLLTLWFGYSFTSVVIVTVIVCVFPIINAATTAMLTIDPARRDLFRLHGATRMQTLWRLRLPSAVPAIATAVRTSSVLAVIGAIVAEFFISSGSQYAGLGYLIAMWQMRGNTAGLIAAVVTAALLGAAIYAIVGWAIAGTAGRFMRLG